MFKNEVKALNVMTRQAKLLVSVKDVEEAFEALEGGADIIDVKDVSHGSLGLPRYGVVREVALKIGSAREKSVPIGDLERRDSAIGYVAQVIEGLGYDYLKVGLKTNSREEGLDIVREVMDSISGKVKVVLVGYADYQLHNLLSPMDVIDIAHISGAYGVMIDTLGKNGLSTFDYLSRDYLRDFVTKAKDHGLLVALAGGLKLHHIRDALSLGFDVIGVRTAACEGGRNGHLRRELVVSLKREVERY